MTVGGSGSSTTFGTVAAKSSHVRCNKSRTALSTSAALMFGLPVISHSCWYSAGVSRTAYAITLS